jgi:hypothetical protein
MGTRRPAVIYGGRVTEQNVDDLIELEALDGVGATRASLDADTFLTIVDGVRPVSHVSAVVSTMLQPPRSGGWSHRA